MKPTKENIRLMLKESNAIEDVWDRYALVQAGRAWRYLDRFDRISPMEIKVVHDILMVGQPLEQRHRGAWRDIPVWIGRDKKSDPPLVIQSKIQDLCDHINKTIENQDNNHQPTHCHVKFEDIHPFVDGNGRVGRIILNWHCLRLGMPLLVYTHTDRRTYYRLFPGYRAMEMERVMKAMGLGGFDLLS